MNSFTHPYEQEEVMTYLDGELSPDRAAGVAAHLRECAQCAELVQQMRAVSVHLTNWSVEPSPASMTKKVEARKGVHSSAKVKRPAEMAKWLDGKFAPLGGRWAWGVGSAVAVAVLLLVIGRQNRLMQQNAGQLLDYMAARTESKRSMPSATP